MHACMHTLLTLVPTAVMEFRSAFNFVVSGLLPYNCLLLAKLFDLVYTACIAIADTVAIHWLQ
jgi:hypothetical protein